MTHSWLNVQWRIQSFLESHEHHDRLSEGVCMSSNLPTNLSRSIKILKGPKGFEILLRFFCSLELFL